MKKLLVPVAIACTALVANAQITPENAQPGECYTKIYYPPVMGTATQQVLVSEASSTLQIIPAKYATKTERVLAKEASTRLEVIPATYKTVTETVVVQPATQRKVRVAGKTRVATEQVLVSPERTMWKRGTSLTEGAKTAGVLRTRAGEDGEIMCLVSVPAVYKTVNRTIKEPDTFRTVDVPAVTKTVTRQVVDRPASTREVPVPAQYSTITKTVLVEPAREVSTPVPAQYRTLTTQVEKSPARTELASVLCKTNATNAKIREIQMTLKSKGYNPGPIDGVVSTRTLGALNAFRRANGMATNAHVTVDTLSKLGVSPR